MTIVARDPRPVLPDRRNRDRARPRAVRRATAGLLALLGLAACGTEPDEGPVVARVGDAALTLAQLDNRVPDSNTADEQRRHYVDGWVRHQLLYQEAVDREVDQNPRVARLLEQSRHDLVVAAFIDNLFDDQPIEVNDTDVEQYYHLNPDRFRRADAEIRVQQIVLGSLRDATALRQELMRGADFAAKARDLSIDRETSGSGGDLGYFTADSRPQIWEACANASPGQLCRNVTLDGAYHILRLNDRQEAGSLRALDEDGVRRSIVESLVRDRHRERIDSLVDDLRGEHTWSIDATHLGAQ